MASELDALTDEVRAPWRRFRDLFEPLRPELYRFCRQLTRSPWDAEDLVQDSMTRAFVMLATTFAELPQPRAWLFRVASNLWIDRLRRARHDPRLEADADTVSETELRSLREAAGTLLLQLSPQERASFVLKDAFDFSLDEIAAMLGTSTLAIKAALHRGRGKLEPAAETNQRSTTPAVLEAFCQRFNAGDLAGLVELLLSTASVEMVGVVTEQGSEAPADRERGSFAGMLSPITFDERGGVRPELLGDYTGAIPRAELRSHRGEPVLLFWYQHQSGPAVRCVMTLESAGQHIARVRNYFFSPDVIAEVCSELGLPHRANGYRYW